MSEGTHDDGQLSANEALAALDAYGEEHAAKMSGGVFILRWLKEGKLK